MGQSPESSYYNSNKQGMPFLQGNRTFGFKYPVFDTYTTYVTKEAQKDDVIMSVRAPVGELNIAPENLCLGRGVCSIRMKNGEQLFLYYLMKANQKQLLNKENGTVFGSVNRNDISNLTVKIPSQNIQKKISLILSTLDDKIELNNKINYNLEQQAQVIFKSWFVDFEPFGGEMPADWRVGKLSELIEYTINGDWGKDELSGTNTEEVFCIRGADIPEVKIGNKGKMPIRYILPKNYQQKKLEDGDLVIEISGGSPTQSTGRVAYISNALLERYNNKIVCTNFCKAVKPQKQYSMYVYYMWQYLYNHNVFFTYENGTTGIKNLDMSGILGNEEIVIPNHEYLSKFNNYCKSVFDSIFSNGAQTEKLAFLRDTLLPKLMSGEIDVDSVQL